MRALSVLTAAVAVLLAILSLDVAAACYTQYDYQSGNYYTICQDQSGTDLRGLNMQNGTMWNERQNRDGTYRGQDGNGNFYQGDNNTGYYSNFGTGEICTGKGFGRICTGGDNDNWGRRR